MSYMYVYLISGTALPAEPRCRPAPKSCVSVYVYCY